MPTAYESNGTGGDAGPNLDIIQHV